MQRAEASDAFIVGSDGLRNWGPYGAAGLLCWDRSRGILMQKRAAWTHFGGTWGVPGGARRAGEGAVHAAFREAAEEADVPARAVQVFGEHVFDLGYWSYTTVLAVVTGSFEPRIMDDESISLEWVPIRYVTDRPMHPGFAKAWPELRAALRQDPLRPR